MDRASLEQLLGQGLSLAEIGRRFGRHEATVSYWVKKHSLEAANREKHAARGVAIALDKLRVEAQKCVLLCSNCHAEVEDGMASVPADALERITPSGVARDDDPG
jgi:transposase-like protein